MTIAPDEVGEFAARADALLINLGTFDADRRAAVEIAIAAATQAGKPWLLDPVFVDRSAQRANYARMLIAKHPHAVRLNRAEFTALSGHELDGAALARFADEIGTTVGMTGDTDIVINGGKLACIANGHPLMSSVTAMGCASGALVGACLAVESDAWVATSAALLIFGVAGQLAGVAASGPGSFAVAMLDALYTLDHATLVERARVM
jgi:hydroxyethylthiazole kinase